MRFSFIKIDNLTVVGLVRYFQNKLTYSIYKMLTGINNFIYLLFNACSDY